MFKPIQEHGKIYGYELERDGCYFFFGTRHADKDELARRFQNYKFCFLNQVHGRDVVDANPEAAAQADAHYTDKLNLALVSQSADCVPILLHSKGRICAIHSGWRGVAQNIVGAAATHMRHGPVFAAVGPHILTQSFEVGLDVADQLLKAAPDPKMQLTQPHGDGKVLFDLRRLVQAQLQAAFGQRLSVDGVAEDTKTNTDFCSFRRDGKHAGRQYSFVVLKG